MKDNKKLVRVVCFAIAAVMIITLFSSVIYSLAAMV